MEVVRRKLDAESPSTERANINPEQTDMPRTSFNCLNWIAQDLFRNNPQHIVKSSKNLYVEASLIEGEKDEDSCFAFETTY